MNKKRGSFIFYAPELFQEPGIKTKYCNGRCSYCYYQLVNYKNFKCSNQELGIKTNIHMENGKQQNLTEIWFDQKDQKYVDSNSLLLKIVKSFERTVYIYFLLFKRTFLITGFPTIWE